MKEQKKESLIKKLTNKLKEKVSNTTSKIGEKLCKSKNKIAIKAAGLALTVALGLTMASCTSNMPTVESTNPNDTTPIVDVDESIDMSDDRYPGLSDTQDLNNKNEALSKYSKLLQDVLTNDTYNNLIAQAKSEAEMGEDDLFYSRMFGLNPYGFLEQKGFNEQSIKNGDIAVGTTAFKKSTEPNNLYINVRAETMSEFPYYTQYCLRYTLSDKEMADFDMLVEGDYIQTSFMVDAISKTKTPEILSETKIDSVCQRNLLKSIEKYSIVESLLNTKEVGDICLLSFSQEEGKAQFMITSETSNFGVDTKGTCNVITISNKNLSIKESSDGCYYGASNYRDYGILAENNTNEPEEITLIHRSYSYADVHNFELN